MELYSLRLVNLLVKAIKKVQGPHQLTKEENMQVELANSRIQDSSIKQLPEGRRQNTRDHRRVRAEFPDKYRRCPLLTLATTTMIFVLEPER